VILHVDRPDFYGAGRRRRAARRPLERRVQGWDIHDDEPAQLLLGLGERPVLNVPTAVLQLDGRGRRDVFQRRPVDISATGDEGLVVSPPGRDVGVGPGRLTRLEVLRCLIDQQDVFHRDLPESMAIPSRRDRLTMMTSTGPRFRQAVLK